jgi:hypothetical protein
VPATKIVWGQVITVLAIVLIAIWTVTEWTAWRLGFQPEFGRPWFEVLHFPFYLPPAFFWWWYAYDACAPSIFIEGAYIASSGGLIAADRAMDCPCAQSTAPPRQTADCSHFASEGKGVASVRVGRSGYTMRGICPVRELRKATMSSSSWSVSFAPSCDSPMTATAVFRLQTWPL